MRACGASRSSRRWRSDARVSSTPIAARSVEGDEAVDAMLSMLTFTDREAYAHAYRVAALSVSVVGRSVCPRSRTGHD